MRFGPLLAGLLVLGVSATPARGDAPPGPIVWAIDVKTDGALAHVAVTGFDAHTPIAAFIPNDWRCTYEPVALIPREGNLVETVRVSCDLKGLGTASTSVGCVRGKPLDRHMAPLVLGETGKPTAELHVMCEGPGAPARAYEPFE